MLLEKANWLHFGYSCISESRGQFPKVESLYITSKAVRGKDIIKQICSLRSISLQTELSA